MSATKNQKPEPQLSERQAATMAYLRAQGVEVTPEDLRAPDISSLAVGVTRPFDFVDKTGRPTPPDIEFYRVEHTGDDPKAQNHRLNTINAKAAEGFVEVRGDHGIHQRGCHTPGQETILMRTADRAEAYRRAQVERERRLLNRRERTRIGEADLEFDQRVTDQRQFRHEPERAE